MTQRRPRLLDPGYLRFLRKMPCCICGRAAPSEAMHIRMTSLAIDKPITGMAIKPDDRYAVPCCAWCHREGPESQHNVGDEAKFWGWYEIDPLALAAKLYAEYGGTGGKPRAPTAVKPRRPRGERTKIQSRGFGPQKRKFGR